MGKPYSMDLRERVVAAVDPGGLSCHRAAAQFGVGVNTAIIWVRRFRETGSFAPGQMGGHKPKKISGKHRDWLLERTKERDFTLRGLVVELADLPGHPARAIARRAKAKSESWLAGRLTDARVKNARERAREIMLLMEGAMALTLIHGGPGYIDAAARVAKQLVRQR